MKHIIIQNKKEHLQTHRECGGSNFFRWKIWMVMACLFWAGSMQLNAQCDANDGAPIFSNVPMCSAYNSNITTGWTLTGSGSGQCQSGYVECWNGGKLHRTITSLPVGNYVLTVHFRQSNGSNNVYYKKSGGSEVEIAKIETILNESDITHNYPFVITEAGSYEIGFNFQYELRIFDVELNKCLTCPSEPTLTAPSNKNRSVCSGSNLASTADGNISYSFGGGATGVTVTFKNAGGTTVTASEVGLNVSSTTSPVVISGVPTETVNYVITTTQSTGCANQEKTDNGTITVQAVSANPIVENQAFCGDKSLSEINSAVTNASGATIKWYNTNGTDALGPFTKTSSPYTLQATRTESGKCESAKSGNVTITIYDAPNLALSAGTASPTVCQGTALPNTIEYTKSGDFGSAAVKFYTNSDKTTEVSDHNLNVNVGSNPVTISGTPSKTVYYEVTLAPDNNSPCVTAPSLNGTITVQAVSANPIVENQAFCGNKSLSEINSAVTNASGATIKWYNTDGTGALGPFTKTSSPYTLQATRTESGKCESPKSGNVTITIYNPPNLTLSAGTASPTVCQGTALPNTIEYTKSGDFGSAAVKFYTDLSKTTEVSDHNLNVNVGSNPVTISGTPSKTVYYEVTLAPDNNSPCETAPSLNGTITVNIALTGVTIPQVDQTAKCAGSGNFTTPITTTLNSGASATTYKWYRAGTATNSGGVEISGATGSSYTPSSVTGTVAAEGDNYYYCIATNASCGGSITSNVSGNYPVAITATSTNQTIEVSDVLTTLTPQFGWTSADPSVASVTDGYKITGLKLGTTTLTNTQGDCVKNITVTVNGKGCGDAPEVTPGIHSPARITNVTCLGECNGGYLWSYTVTDFSYAIIGIAIPKTNTFIFAGTRPFTDASNNGENPNTANLAVQHPGAAGNGTFYLKIEKTSATEYTITRYTEAEKPECSCVTGASEGQEICGEENFVSLQVAAAASTGYTFQWFISTTNTGEGGTILNSQEDIAAGSQTATYTPQKAKQTVGIPYYYYCEVSKNEGGMCGKTISGAHVVTGECVAPCVPAYFIKIWGTQITINGVNRPTTEVEIPIIPLCDTEETTCGTIYKFTLTSTGENSNFGIYTDPDDESTRDIFYPGGAPTLTSVDPRPILPDATNLSFNRCGERIADGSEPADNEHGEVGCLIYTPSAVSTQDYYLVIDPTGNYITNIYPLAPKVLSDICTTGEPKSLPAGDGGTWTIKSGTLVTLAGTAGNQTVAAASKATGTATLIYTNGDCVKEYTVKVKDCEECPAYGSNDQILCMGIPKQLNPATGWTLISGNAILNPATGILTTNGSAAGGNTVNVRHCSQESDLVLTVYSMPTLSSHPSTAAVTSKCQNDGNFSTLMLSFAQGASASRSYQWYKISGSATPGNPGAGGSPITGATNESYTPPTTEVGTFHYYCIIKNNQSAPANICEVTSNISAAHTVKTDGCEPVDDCETTTLLNSRMLCPTGTSQPFTFENSGFTPVGEFQDDNSCGATTFRVRAPSSFYIYRQFTLTPGIYTFELNSTGRDLGNDGAENYFFLSTTSTYGNVLTEEKHAIAGGTTKTTITKEIESGTHTYYLGVYFPLNGVVTIQSITMEKCGIGGSLNNISPETQTQIDCGGLSRSSGNYYISGSGFKPGGGVVRLSLSDETNFEITDESGNVLINETRVLDGYNVVNNGKNVRIRLKEGVSSNDATYNVTLTAENSDNIAKSKSATFQITVKPAINKGSIEPAEQTICSASTVTINGTAAPATAASPSGTTSEGITYEWLYKAAGGEFTAATNISANNADYEADAALSPGTYQFKRQAKYTTSGCMVETDPVTVVINPPFTAGTISGMVEICAGGSVVFNGEDPAAGGVGAITYQWQYEASPDNWLPAAGTNNTAAYTAENLTADAKFRREAINTCGTVYSNESTVKVNQQPVAGTIPDIATICGGKRPAQLTPVDYSTEGVSYKWYFNTDGSDSWELINGETNASFLPGTLLVDTWYKFEVSNKNGSCTPASDTIKVNVRPTPALAEASGRADNCAGDQASSILTSTQVLYSSEVLRWYDDEGILKKTGASSEDLIFDANYGGETLTAGWSATCYVEIFDGTCASSQRTPVTVTVKGVEFNVRPETEKIGGTPSFGNVLKLHDYCDTETERFVFGTFESNPMKDFIITGSCLSGDVEMTLSDGYKAQVLYKDSESVVGNPNDTITIDHNTLNAGGNYIISVINGQTASEFDFNFTNGNGGRTQVLCVMGRPDEPSLDILVNTVSGLGYFWTDNAEMKEKRFTVEVTNLGTALGMGAFYKLTGQNANAFEVSVGTAAAPGNRWVNTDNNNDSTIALVNGRNYVWVRLREGAMPASNPTSFQDFSATLTLTNKAGEGAEYIVKDSVMFLATVYPEKTGDYCDERDEKTTGNSSPHQYAVPDYSLMNRYVPGSTTEKRDSTSTPSASMNESKHHYVYLNKPTSNNNIGFSSTPSSGSIYVEVQGPVSDSYTINFGNINGPVHIKTFDVDSMNIAWGTNGGYNDNYLIVDGNTRYGFTTNGNNVPVFLIIEEFTSLSSGNQDIQLGTNSNILNKGTFTVGRTTGNNFGNGLTTEGSGTFTSSSNGFAFNGAVFINEGTMNVRGSFVPANQNTCTFVNRGVVRATGHLIFNSQGLICLADGACFTVDKGVGATNSIATAGAIRGRGGFHFKENVISYNIGNHNTENEGLDFAGGKPIAVTGQSISISWTSTSKTSDSNGNVSTKPLTTRNPDGSILVNSRVKQSEWGTNAIVGVDDAGGCEVCYAITIPPDFSVMCATPGQEFKINLGLDSNFPAFIWEVSDGGSYSFSRDKFGEVDSIATITFPPTFNGIGKVTISYDYGQMSCKKDVYTIVAGSAPLLWKGEISKANPDIINGNPEAPARIGVWDDPANWYVAGVGNNSRDIDSVAALVNPTKILPSGCTDVYLQALDDAMYYPTLEKDDSECKDIYFGSNTSIGKIHKLTYQRAFVDMTIERWTNTRFEDRWHMVSAPLRNMVSGDYTYNGDYRIASYIRYFSVDAHAQVFTGSWAKSISSPTVRLENGMGYAFRYSSPVARNHTFRFPSDPNTQSTNAFRFIFETPSIEKEGDSYLINFDLRDRLGDELYEQWQHKVDAGVMINDSASAYIVVGNPFMSHLDLHAFYHDNSDYILPNIKCFISEDNEGFATHKLEEDPTDMSLSNACGAGFSTDKWDGKQTLRFVPPMQSFFVALKDGVKHGDIQLRFNPNHTVASTAEFDRLRGASVTDNLLTLSAVQAGRSSLLALVNAREGAVNNFFAMEDAQKLFSNDSPLQLYTMAGEVPTDINAINANSLNGLIIPIGIRTKVKGQVTLDITGITSFPAADNIWFVDAQEGTRTSLFAQESFTLDLATGTHEDRFFLYFDQEEKGDGDDDGGKTDVNDVEVTANNIFVSTNGNMLNVLSKGELIESVTVHDISGRIVYTVSGIQATYFSHRLPAVQAVYMVHVVTAKESVTQKVVIK